MTQFYEAKSYPTFTPVDPALVLLDPDEVDCFDDLRLCLWVNGELRQDMCVVDDMIYKPLEALHPARHQVAPVLPQTGGQSSLPSRWRSRRGGGVHGWRPGGSGAATNRVRFAAGTRT